MPFLFFFFCLVFVQTKPWHLVSLQALVMAVQSLVETVVSFCSQDLPLLNQIFTLLTPNENEWMRIRQALPPQVTQQMLVQNMFFVEIK